MKWDLVPVGNMVGNRTGNVGFVPYVGQWGASPSRLAMAIVTGHVRTSLDLKESSSDSAVSTGH